MNHDVPPKTVILLGVGHTNAHVVKEWASHPIKNCRLICVSTYPTATYSGMLPGTLGGQFRDDEWRIDLQALAKRSGAELVLAETSGLDLTTGQLLFQDHAPIAFDALSIGVGSIPAGRSQHADSPLLVPIKPMQTFLQRLEEHVQQAQTGSADALRIAIVGGGVASVEVALCFQQLWQRRRGQKIALEIFTNSERVADGMQPKSVRRIEKLLQQRDISVYANQRVVELQDDALITSSGQRFPTDCVIWATGAAPPPVLGQLGLATDERGFIATSKTLQSLTDPRIFAVGDSGTILASPAPKAGVYAVRQSPILWHNLRAFLAHQPLREYQPQSDFLKLLNTGDGKVLMEFKGLCLHARWCWYFKTWIDKHFVRSFKL